MSKLCLCSYPLAKKNKRSYGILKTLLLMFLLQKSNMAAPLEVIAHCCVTSYDVIVLCGITWHYTIAAWSGTTLGMPLGIPQMGCHDRKDPVTCHCLLNLWPWKNAKQDFRCWVLWLLATKLLCYIVEPPWNCIISSFYQFFFKKFSARWNVIMFLFKKSRKVLGLSIQIMKE